MKNLFCLGHRTVVLYVLRLRRRPCNETFMSPWPTLRCAYL